MQAASMTDKLTASRQFHVAREGLGCKRFRKGEEAAKSAGSHPYVRCISGVQKTMNGLNTLSTRIIWIGNFPTIDHDPARKATIH